MSDNQDIKNRLKLFIEYLEMSVKAFEESCGLSNGYVSSIRKGIGHRALEQITEKYWMLSKSWLLTGDGNMLVENSTNIRIKANTIGNQAHTVHGSQISERSGDVDYKALYFQVLEEKEALQKQLMECKDECVRIKGEVLKEKERYVLLLERMTK